MPGNADATLFIQEYTAILGQTELPATQEAVELAELPIASHGSFSAPAAVIRTGKLEIELRNSATPALISALKELVLPDGLKVIEDCAFDGAGLTSITVPQSVESIGSLSFARCANLTTALVPAALSVSKSSQFYACEALAEISRY